MVTASVPTLLSDFSVSLRAVLQIQLLSVPERSTTILDAEGKMMVELMVLENKTVNTYLFYEPQSRLGVSAIVINGKRLERLLRAQQSAKKNTRVQCRSRCECLSSATKEVKNVNVLMDIGLDDAENPVSDNETAIRESALRKYCSIFHFPF